jgi:hypothetical protein
MQRLYDLGFIVLFDRLCKLQYPKSEIFCIFVDCNFKCTSNRLNYEGIDYPQLL